MHVLISLSYLNRSELLRSYVESAECQFSDKISAFVEYYSKVPLNANIDLEDSRLDTKSDQPPQVDDENGDIDKRTILDLCAHMFHPNRQNENDLMDNSLDQMVTSFEIGEYNDMRTDDRIKEFENEQGDLIFECFQDEEMVL